MSDTDSRSFRAAAIDDLKAIQAFDPDARSDKERFAFIREAITSGICTVCTESANVIAYGILDYSFFRCGFIPLIYVTSEKRGLGIGRTLMGSLELQCRTAKLFTSTNQSNSPMKRLLTSLGFAESGIIHNLDPGDPEIIYYKAVTVSENDL